MMPNPKFAQYFRRASASLIAPAAQLYPAGERFPRLMLLDGLRGFAAVAVVFFHYRYFSYPPGWVGDLDVKGRRPLEGLFGALYDGGHFGVQLFWMISGVVFAAVYYGRSATSREFVVNRFARLYPLHLATLLLVSVEQWACTLRFGTQIIVTGNDAWHFFLQLAFASQWLLSFGNSFNFPIWSVSVEVLIYAVFWLSRRWVPGFGIAGPLAVAAGMVVLHSLIGGSLVFMCGFNFFVGVALCGFWRAFAAMPRLTLAVGTAAALFGGIVYPQVPLQQHHWALREALLLPMLMAGVLLAVISAEDLVPISLRRAMAAFGDRTYSIYLIHIPLQILLFLLLGRQIAGLAQHAWFLALYLALVLAIAWLCYRWFEAPMREWLRRYARPARSEPHAVGASAV